VRDQRDVAGHEPAADGIAERTADDEVDLVDGLGREAGAPVSGVEQPVVERLEVMGAQPAKADASYRRQYVALDVALVAGVGGGDEHELLAREPPDGEIHAEAQ
jgi:hypothetical protein